MKQSEVVTREEEAKATRLEFMRVKSVLMKDNYSNLFPHKEKESKKDDRKPLKRQKGEEGPRGKEEYERGRSKEETHSHSQHNSIVYCSTDTLDTTVDWTRTKTAKKA